MCAPWPVHNGKLEEGQRSLVATLATSFSVLVWAFHIDEAMTQTGDGQEKQEKVVHSESTKPKRKKKRGKGSQLLHRAVRNLEYTARARVLRVQSVKERDPDTVSESGRQLVPSLPAGGMTGSSRLSCLEPVIGFYLRNPNFNQVMEVEDVGDAKQVLRARRDLAEGELLCPVVGNFVREAPSEGFRVERNHYIDTAGVDQDLGYLLRCTPAYVSPHRAPPNYCKLLRSGGASLRHLRNCELVRDELHHGLLWFRTTRSVKAGDVLIRDRIAREFSLRAEK